MSKRTQMEIGFKEEKEEHFNTINEALSSAWEDGKAGRTEARMTTEDVLRAIVYDHLKENSNYYKKSRLTPAERGFLSAKREPIGKIGRIIKQRSF